MENIELPSIEEKEILMHFIAVLKENGACSTEYVNIISTYFFDGLQEVRKAFDNEKILNLQFQILALLEDVGRGDTRLNLLLNMQNN